MINFRGSFYVALPDTSLFDLDPSGSALDPYVLRSEALNKYEKVLREEPSVTFLNQRILSLPSSDYCRRLDSDYPVHGEHASSLLPFLTQVNGERLSCCNFNRETRRRIYSGEGLLVVDVYCWDGDSDTERELLKIYSTRDLPANDGDIYRQIRKFQGAIEQKFRCPHLESCYMEILSASSRGRRSVKKGNLKRLLKETEILNSLDKLYLVEGLWPDWRFGNWHKILSLRCAEVNSYMERIVYIWYTICGGDKSMMARIDNQTVRALEGKSPGLFREEEEALVSKMRENKLLTAFNAEEKQIIWSRIAHVTSETAILSFKSFFKDCNYLHSLHESLRHIMKAPWRGSTVAYFQSIFDERRVCEEDATELMTSWSTRLSCFAQSYAQLWLYCMREYVDSPASVTRKNILAKPRARPQRDTVAGLARLALRLGFASDHISTLCAEMSSMNFDGENRLSQSQEGSSHLLGYPYMSDYKRDKRNINLKEFLAPARSSPGLTSSIFSLKSKFAAFLGYILFSGPDELSPVTGTIIDLYDPVSSIASSPLATVIRNWPRTPLRLTARTPSSEYTLQPDEQAQSERVTVSSAETTSTLVPNAQEALLVYVIGKNGRSQTFTTFSQKELEEISARYVKKHYYKIFNHNIRLIDLDACVEFYKGGNMPQVYLLHPERKFDFEALAGVGRL